MALMERVATLLRANLADLIERAEDPEKVLRQLVLDIQNQLLQVKTQVALALADQHLLEGRAREQAGTAADWHAKAERAVTRGDDAGARAALERALHHEALLSALRAQIANQAHDAEAIRASYAKLQAKLSETEARCDLLIAEHRRLRLLQRASETKAGGRASDAVQVEVLGRFQDRLTGNVRQAVREAATGPDDLQARFEQTDRDERVEDLLAALKSRKARGAPTA